MEEHHCIFPEESVIQLQQPENSEVLTGLTRFCGCTAEELIAVLTRRNTKSAMHGYSSYTQRSGKKGRNISVPDPNLEKIQDHLRTHLEKIPISLSATGGKIGDSQIKNAELHKAHPYLITMDIKDAYPSVNTKRVYTNLQGAIHKALTIRCPLLESPQEKNMFIKALTHLLVYRNQLPQGASTSNQVLNIVLCKLDMDIEKTIAQLVPHGVYSRYVDDIAVSFPHYATQAVLQETLSMIEQLIERGQHHADGAYSKERIDHALQEFSQCTFSISDKKELAFLQQRCTKMALKLSLQKNQTPDDIRKRIGQLHQYQQQVTYVPHGMKNIKEELLAVIGQNGLRAKDIKTKMYTPHSGGMKEITGIAYTADGRRGISSAKKGAIKRFFQDLATLTPEALLKNRFYNDHFKDRKNQTLDGEKIIASIEGKYAHIVHVYGKNNVPKELAEAYHAAKERWGSDHSPVLYERKEYKEPIKRNSVQPYDDLPF